MVDLRRNPNHRYTVVLSDGDGNHVLTVRMKRRGVDGQPLRREPEPTITIASVARFYETHAMGNDVYAWDWQSIGNGRLSSNFPDSPVEHRVADGPVTLMEMVLERLIW